MKNIKRVLVTGGAGYVGAVLVPELVQRGYDVRVLDLYLFGDSVLKSLRGNPRLEEIKGDLRSEAVVKQAVEGCDAVIHLACISNDPSFELNPDLGKSINYDAFGPLVRFSKEAGVRRFIYASSSSVYGLRSEENVTEDLPLLPLTDYSKYKALCEEVLQRERSPGFVTLTLRPATVCGYSPRLRLDLTVNILTNHAVNKGVITVFGGPQMRPNFHIKDAAALYIQSLEWPDALIDGETFNAGYQNRTVDDIATIVRSIVGPQVEIVHKATDDNRSYHISSTKIEKKLGFKPQHTIEEAVTDLVAAFRAGDVPDPMSDIRYYNIKTMQAGNLT
jgi:nucleoside-diphosphate-sugar epimerase